MGIGLLVLLYILGGELGCLEGDQVQVELVVNVLLLLSTEVTANHGPRAYIFPNVGFTIATINIGETFGSQSVTWVGSAMTCLLVVAYIFVFSKHVQAAWTGQILMEGKDEDVFVHEKMGKLEKPEGKAEGQFEEAAERSIGNNEMLRQRNLEHTEGGAA